MMLLLSAAPVLANDPTRSTLQSGAVSTTQQPLPIPLGTPGICGPDAQTSTNDCDKGIAGSSAPVSPAWQASSAEHPTKPFTLALFWGEGCTYCEHEKDFLKDIAGQFPTLQVKLFEVWHDRDNAAMLNRLAEKYGLRPSGVPVTFINEKAYVGFSNAMKSELISIMKQCAESGCPDPLDRLKESVSTPPVSTMFKKPVSKPSLTTAAGKTAARVFTSQRPAPSAATATKSGKEDTHGKEELIDVPLLGRLDLSGMSLPVMTVVIAGLDSFNPCAFFVLFALLGLLVHARSRARMVFIGGIFIFFSGFIYFLFMAAWLNLFLVMGQVALITTIAGVVSVIIAGINIKDFFSFKSGVSLTIPDSAKPKLYDRMRKLMRSTSIVSMVIGSTALAIAANTYELLCTAGFPMVFTRILTLSNLATATYYTYLALYNIIYVIPLTVIVALFTVTLGKRQLTERQGRVLKLVSGMMMLGLGIVLIAKPALLNNVLASVALLAGALLISFVVIGIEKKLYGAAK